MDKEIVARLRAIPVDVVRERFGLIDVEDKRVRNGLDVLVFQGGQTFQEAARTLAEAFPGVAAGDGLARPVEATKSIRERAGAVPLRLRRTAGNVLRQLDAFGCEVCHVFASGPEGGYSSRKKFPGGMDEEQLLSKLPYLARINANGGNIFFAPIHAEGKISIPVDDVRQEFLQIHRPSVLMATSDRSRQAHYILDVEYDFAFYDYLTAKINEQYGDPKITSAAHDTRLAGFSNRKRPCLNDSSRFPFVQIIESCPMRCRTFEECVDDVHREWMEDKQAQAEAANRQATQAAMDGLREVGIPQNVADEAAQYRAWIVSRYSPLDRSRADHMIASRLHSLGVDSNVIFSLIFHCPVQDQEKVLRRHIDGTPYAVVKNATPEARRRYAMRTTVNALRRLPA